MVELEDVKHQLRLDPDFTEHDGMLERLISAAQRTIERNYNCRLVKNQEELDKLPSDVRGFLIEADFQLAALMAIDSWYNNSSGQSVQEEIPIPIGFEFLLHPLKEHAIG